MRELWIFKQPRANLGAINLFKSTAQYMDDTSDDKKLKKMFKQRHLRKQTLIFY